MRRGPLLIGSFIALLTIALLALLYRSILFSPLPRAESIASGTLAPSSMILDRSGTLLYELQDPHGGFHRPVPLEEIPQDLRRAVIATEDATFYQNPGFDTRAIARALWLNLRSGEIVSGGSTIAQQVARNLLMDPRDRLRRTWERKAREAILAHRLTHSLSKNEILSLYLNEIYFGNMAYGVEAAARAYFAKPVAQLDLAECALIAGLPQAPEGYNPMTHRDAAKERQRVVLGLMVKAGYLTASQADQAQREPLHYSSAPLTIESPHFCMLVREELGELVGETALRQGGLRVHTTLDLDLQRAAESHVQRHLSRLDRESTEGPGHQVSNAAVVVLESRTGEVRAMIGSPDYFDPRIDGAVNAALSLRQPGSAIKPLTYAAAFERGLSPATVVSDVPSSFTTREGLAYVPINYDYRFHGPVSLRRALACSYNVVAVRVLDKIGVAGLSEMAGRMGLTTLRDSDHYGLSLTLGSGEVQLRQLVGAYGTLANGGLLVQSPLIDRVTDTQGRVLYQRPEGTPRRVLNERVAYLITDILSDREARVAAFGEGSELELFFPAAVKTGTTTDWRDNWALGYTSAWVVGVWVGNANNEPMRQVTGLTGAAPIWREVMLSAHRRAPEPIPRPSGLIETQVCAESGQLPGAACAHLKGELFLAENRPSDPCEMHRLVVVDARTGQVAGPDCPPERRFSKKVTFWPPEAVSWAVGEGLPLPPPDSSSHLAMNRVEPIGEGGEPPLYLSLPLANSAYVVAPDIPARFQQLEIAVDGFALPRITELHLWIDGSPQHTWRQPPYRVLWPLEPGSHTFRVEGTDAQGERVQSESVSVSVFSQRQSSERVAP